MQSRYSQTMHAVTILVGDNGGPPSEPNINNFYDARMLKCMLQHAQCPFTNLVCVNDCKCVTKKLRSLLFRKSYRFSESWVNTVAVQIQVILISASIHALYSQGEVRFIAASQSHYAHHYSIVFLISIPFFATIQSSIGITHGMVIGIHPIC